MSLKLKLSKSESLKLLLVCAMPVHFWAFMMIFMEADIFMIKRDFVFGLGFAGYLLGLAILESLLLFVFVSLLTIIFPTQWEGKKPLAVSSAIGLVIAFWAVGNQFHFLMKAISPAWFERILFNIYAWQNLTYPLLWIVVILSSAFPIILLPRWKAYRKRHLDLMDKIVTLAPLYLFFDLVGLSFTLIRNIQ